MLSLVSQVRSEKIFGHRSNLGFLPPLFPQEKTLVHKPYKVSICCFCLPEIIFLLSRKIVPEFNPHRVVKNKNWNAGELGHYVNNGIPVCSC